MRYRISALRFVVGSVLLVALSATLCAAQWGNKKYERLIADGRYTDGPSIGGMPQKSVPAVEVPRTTYVEMLGRGYARIGEFRYSSDKHESDVGKCKKDMLEMAMFRGADVAWVDTYTESVKGREWVDQHTYYPPDGHSYTISAHSRNKTFKSVYGGAVYFVHNPELAAKQLEEGRKKWEMRAVEIPKKRVALAAMLDTILIKLSAMDASQVWPGGSSKEKYTSGIRAAKDELEKGNWGVSWPQSFQDAIGYTGNGVTNKYPGFVAFLDLNQFLNDYKGHHGAESSQLSELDEAVKAAWSYAWKNWDIIVDEVTLGSTDHFYPY